MTIKGAIEVIFIAVSGRRFPAQRALVLPMVLAIPFVLTLAACGPAATSMMRTTSPVGLEVPATASLDDDGPSQSPPPLAASEACHGCLRGLAGAIVSERRAVAPVAYLPRRVPCQEIERIARQAAQRTGLEQGLLIGVMRVESAFTSNAISPAAAVGLSQVLPSIGERLGCGDLFDPVMNASCGATVLARWLDRFKGNLISALSGYNAGHSMPTHARDERRTPRNFQYVEDVLRARSRFLRQGCRAFDATAAR